ncbi:MAG: helix-turn-helix domain-containing protein [Anaerococcus vaginalis]|nr:helix-turn-helix domain-containing protein [Anaerococcus vaginalis]
MIDIYNNIKVYRAMKDISQKDLAKAVGLTQQTISRAENYSAMSLTTARKIAEYFGVGIDDIFLTSNTINNSKNKNTSSKKLF